MSSAPNISVEDFDSWRRPESVAVPVVFGVVFLVGVIGNGTLLHIICWNRRMRTPPNAYIFNIAFGDFILMVASVPFTATTFTFREWPYEEIICKLSQSIQTISVALTAFSLAGVSIERFRVITSKRYAHGKPNSFLCGTITFAWIFALLLGIPDAMSAYVKRVESPGGVTMQFCRPHSPAWGLLYAKIFSTVKFGLTYVAPLVLVPFFYCLIGFHLLYQKRHNKGEKKDLEDTTGDTDEKPVVEDEKKRRTHPRTMVKTVFALTLSLIICWLPRHVYVLRYNYWDDDFDHFWRIFNIIGFCLAFLNSCLNPVIIYFIDRKFRRHFKHYLFCCCFSDPKKNRHKHRHRHHKKDDARWRKMQGQDAVRRQRGYDKMNGYQSDFEVKRRDHDIYAEPTRARRYSDGERYYGYLRDSRSRDSPDYDYRRYNSDARFYAKRPYYDRYQEYDRYYGNGYGGAYDSDTKRKGIYDTYPKRHIEDVVEFPDKRIYDDPRRAGVEPQFESTSEYAEIRKGTDSLGREDKEVAEYTSHMTEANAAREDSSTPEKESQPTTPSQERETMSKELYL